MKTIPLILSMLFLVTGLPLFFQNKKIEEYKYYIDRTNEVIEEKHRLAGYLDQFYTLVESGQKIPSKTISAYNIVSAKIVRMTNDIDPQREDLAKMHAEFSFESNKLKDAFGILAEIAAINDVEATRDDHDRMLTYLDAANNAGERFNSLREEIIFGDVAFSFMYEEDEDNQEKAKL